MKIVEYTVAASATVESIIKLVNIKIQEGWQPFGQLSDFDHDQYFYQVLVKYENV